MTYTPYDPSTYDDEEQLEKYRENPGQNFDGLYEGQTIVEGRPGPDGKVKETEQPTKEEPKKEEPNLIDKVKGAVQDFTQPNEDGSPSFGSAIKDGLKSAAYQQAAPALAGIDFGLDAVGKIPGASWIDDAWDEKTKFSNPNLQATRDVASVILPSIGLTMVAGPLGSKAGAAVGGGKIIQGLSAISATAATDAAVTGLSDYSERDEGMARGLDNFLESIGRPMDLSIPDSIMVKDDDSPDVRRRKLMMETAGLSIVGDALAYIFQAGKPIMNWFKPKDEVADTFKQINIRENPDPETVFRTQEIDEEIMQLTDEIDAAGDADVSELIQRRDILQEESAQLYQTYFNTGRTSATTDPLESYVAAQQASREWQTDEVGAIKLQTDPEMAQFDPDVQSVLADESSRPRQAIPRGNVARNAADIGAIESGVSEGVPAPLISYPMLKEGMGLDSDSRKIVTALTDEYRGTGEFDAVVDGYRQSKKDIDDNTWNLAAKIVSAKDADELRDMFLSRKNMMQITEDFATEQLIPGDVPGVGKAIAVLAREYLGQDVTAMSAKSIFTTAQEVDSHLEAMRLFRGQVDEDAVFDVIKDKLQFLTDEYGLYKYSWGWSGRNLKWWQKQPNAEEVLEQFQNARERISQSSRDFTADLARLKAENPTAANTLLMAYDLSKGDIDSYAKLQKWASDQMKIGSVFISGQQGESLFSRGLWGVLYNNSLSGLSAGRAAVGNISALALKPVDYMIGAGMRGILKGDFEPLRRGAYAFGISGEMTQRALKEGWDMFKKASNDPQSVMDMARKDYQRAGEVEAWEVMDRMEAEYIKNKQYGKLAMLRWMQVNKRASMSKFMRYGQNLMMGIDQMSNFMQGTMISKFRAWDEVYTKGQKLDVERLDEAQRLHYSKVFDPKTNGINDKWLNTQARELALNEDTAFGEDLSKFISKYPALRFAVMFPNTGINFVRKAISYTPFAALPNSNKYAKTILAKTPEQINEALTLHGIPINDPQANMIIDNLKNEYLGRMATGSMVTMGLTQYAMGGNIRGNYPRDSRDKQFLISQGWKPKTIKIGGVWQSYDGIIPLDPLLTMLGDMSYYANDISSPFMEDIQSKIAWTVTQSFSGATPLQGLEPLVALAQGDETAMSRFIANTSRLGMPLSSAQAVLAKAFDNTTKEIYNDTQGYIASRIPIANALVPDKYDWWTGQKVNEIDNPVLRILNAVNPIPMTATEEPWRVWVNQSGFDTSTLILKDSTNSYEYTPEQRSIMSKYIGEQQIYKEVEKMMKNPKYNDQLDTVRAELATGKTYDQLQPDTKKLPVLRKLTALVTSAKQVAEDRMYKEYPKMRKQIQGKLQADNLMTQGRVSEAYDKAEKTQQQVQQLQQFR